MHTLISCALWRGRWCSTSMRLRDITQQTWLAALEPCGCIVQDVMDGKGESPDDYSLTCNDVKQPFTRRITYESGMSCFNNLPLGDVKITVNADGYKAKEIELNLKQGAPEEVRTILDPLQGSMRSLEKISVSWFSPCRKIDPRLLEISSCRLFPHTGYDLFITD